jgi:hypothetical protein
MVNDFGRLVEVGITIPKYNILKTGLGNDLFANIFIAILTRAGLLNCSNSSSGGKINMPLIMHSTCVDTKYLNRETSQRRPSHRCHSLKAQSRLSSSPKSIQYSLT